jgi:hypothetical protein
MNSSSYVSSLYSNYSNLYLISSTNSLMTLQIIFIIIFTSLDLFKMFKIKLLHHRHLTYDVFVPYSIHYLWVLMKMIYFKYDYLSYVQIIVNYVILFFYFFIWTSFYATHLIISHHHCPTQILNFITNDINLIVLHHFNHKLINHDLIYSWALNVFNKK